MSCYLQCIMLSVQYDKRNRRRYIQHGDAGLKDGLVGEYRGDVGLNDGD
jgi:hypothetical protein